jgi:predicted O-methyltransferase YrrM
MLVVFNETGTEVELSGELAALAVAATSDMMDAHELTHLIAGLQLAGVGPDELIVEIGAFTGATTVLLHRALQYLGNDSAPVLSIDAFEASSNEWGNPRGSYRRFRRRIAAAAAGHRCFALVGFSQDAHRAVPAGLALLVIDGDHRFEAVRSDLDHYTSKVRAGGVVFVDDYSAESYPEVVAAVDQFLERHGEFVVLHRSWFAVLQRRPD